MDPDFRFGWTRGKLSIGNINFIRATFCIIQLQKDRVMCLLQGFRRQVGTCGEAIDDMTHTVRTANLQNVQMSSSSAQSKENPKIRFA